MQRWCQHVSGVRLITITRRAEGSSTAELNINRQRARAAATESVLSPSCVWCVVRRGGAQWQWLHGRPQRGTLKMRDLKMRHQTAGVENAGLESAGNDIVWNAAHCLCLLSFAWSKRWVGLKELECDRYRSVVDQLTTIATISSNQTYALQSSTLQSTAYSWKTLQPSQRRLWTEDMCQYSDMPRFCSDHKSRRRRLLSCFGFSVVNCQLYASLPNPGRNSPRSTHTTNLSAAVLNRIMT